MDCHPGVVKYHPECTWVEDKVEMYMRDSVEEAYSSIERALHGGLQG